MSAKHTPGPWVASAHIIYSGPHHRVATVQHVGLKGEADARLIAEAPAMLDVIRRLHEGDTTPPAIDAILAECRAIIARVEA